MLTILKLYEKRTDQIKMETRRTVFLALGSILAELEDALDDIDITSLSNTGENKLVSALILMRQAANKIEGIEPL